jgi:hypothetical protein
MDREYCKWTLGRPRHRLEVINMNLTEMKHMNVNSLELALDEVWSQGFVSTVMNIQVL